MALWSSEKSFILSIFITALAARIAALMLLGGGCFQTDAVCEPIGDQKEYLELAANLRAGKGLYIEQGYSQAGAPYAYRGPGYPLIAAATLAISHDHLFVLRVVQLLLSLMIPLAAYFMLRAFVSPGIAWFFGMVSAAAPYFFYHALFFLADHMYQICMITSVSLLCVGITKKSSLFLMLSICGALAALIRAEGFYLSLLGVILLVVLAIRKKVSWRSTALYLIMLFIPVLLWCGRNYYHFRIFALQSRTAPLSMAWSYTPDFTGSPWPEYDVWFKKTLAEVEQIKDEKSAADYLTTELKSFFLAHPTAFVRITALKALQVWKVRPQKQHMWGASPFQAGYFAALGVVFYGIWIPLALLGAVGFWRREKIFGWYVGGFIVVATLIAALASQAIRHRIVIMPFFYLLCAYGAVMIKRACQSRRVA